MAALAAAAGLAGLVRLAATPGPAVPVQPSDRQLAQRAVGRYFAFIDQGRGAEFCSEAISGATLDAEGGIYHCATTIDRYVSQIRRRTFAAALTDMHLLFYMVDDGIGSHCLAGRPCPRNLFARWASESASPQIDWRTGSDPRLASSLGARVVAVVDPRRSSPDRITLYYQAPDGRILRASWSTAFGSWRGSVVDTHAGDPFVSHVRVLATRRTGDSSLVATVSMRVGTAAPTVEQFQLVEEGGSWRADSWVDVTAALSV
ncbi:MAG TPA: hypothetical protein VMS63_06875 [Gaiellaceae bacterium]|nr:hypothetical protein [Gaiellaceae bacterium]